jgi:hypothetical protein
VKPLHITEAKSLEFVDPESEDLEVRHGDAPGFEDPVTLEMAAFSMLDRSRHVLDSFCAYAHYT